MSEVNKEERRYIGNLVREFGAKVLLDLPEREPMGYSALALARVKARGQTEGCYRCALGEQASSHVPVEWPGRRISARAMFAVVGEAPGPDEDRAGRPFIGKAGKLLRGALQQCDINANDDVAYVNAVSCFPHDEEKQPSGKVRKIIRPPSDGEMLQCYGNFMAQLGACDVRYVLLLGSTALKLWRKDLRVTQQQGKWGVWNQRWFVYSLLHPSAVLRGVEGQAEWGRKVAQFVEVVREGAGGEVLGTQCMKFEECGEGFWAWDMDGLPWCKGHFEQGWDGHERTVKWWMRETAKLEQGVML